MTREKAKKKNRFSSIRARARAPERGKEKERDGEQKPRDAWF